MTRAALPFNVKRSLEKIITFHTEKERKRAHKIHHNLRNFSSQRKTVNLEVKKWWLLTKIAIENTIPCNKKDSHQNTEMRILRPISVTIVRLAYGLVWRIDSVVLATVFSMAWPKNSCLYSENTRDSWDILWYTTRKGCTTSTDIHSITEDTIIIILLCEVYSQKTPVLIHALTDTGSSKKGSDKS